MEMVARGTVHSVRDPLSGSGRMSSPSSELAECTVCGQRQLAIVRPNGVYSDCERCSAAGLLLADYRQTCAHRVLVYRRKSQALQCDSCGELYAAANFVP